MLWMTYFFFSLAALSWTLMMVAFMGVVADRGLSRGIFNSSAFMTVLYTGLSLVTGRLIG